MLHNFFNVKISEIFNNQTLKIHSVPPSTPLLISIILNIFLDKFTSMLYDLYYTLVFKTTDPSECRS